MLRDGATKYIVSSGICSIGMLTKRALLRQVTTSMGRVEATVGLEVSEAMYVKGASSRSIVWETKAEA